MALPQELGLGPFVPAKFFFFLFNLNVPNVRTRLAVFGVNVEEAHRNCDNGFGINHNMTKATPANATFFEHFFEIGHNDLLA